MWACWNKLVLRLKKVQKSKNETESQSVARHTTFPLPTKYRTHSPRKNNPKCVQILISNFQHQEQQATRWFLVPSSTTGTTGDTMVLDTIASRCLQSFSMVRLSHSSFLKLHHRLYAALRWCPKKLAR
jgi:hypothetical protein